MTTKIMIVAFSGFAAVCFLLIGFFNMDQFNNNPLTCIIPVLLGIIFTGIFCRRVYKL